MATCLLCGSQEFTDRGGRKFCASCKAGGRTQLLGYAMRNAVPASDSKLPVIHISPEGALVRIMKTRFGDAWTPADFDPPRWERARNGRPVQFCDLSEPAKFYPPESVQGFVHSHVLEHIPVPMDKVLSEMNAAVEPGGFHAFIVPGPFPDHYDEDLGPLSPEERVTRFGHPEHMRHFGRLDWPEVVLRHFEGWRQIPMSSYITPDQLRGANIPAGQTLDKLTGTTVHLFVKP